MSTPGMGQDILSRPPSYPNNLYQIHNDISFATTRDKQKNNVIVGVELNGADCYKTLSVEEKDQV